MSGRVYLGFDPGMSGAIAGIYAERRPPPRAAAASQGAAFAAAMGDLAEVAP